MELSDIYSKLLSTGIPVAYLKFDKPQTLPFMVYYESDTAVKGADRFNLYRESAVIIELYSAAKNIQLERQIEMLFRDRELVKTADTYLDEENMFMAAYSFENITKYGG